MDENRTDPKVEQSLMILQMDNAQLNEYLTGKMMENPMIEMDAVSPDDSQVKIFQRKMKWLEQQHEKEAEQSVYFDPDMSRPAQRKAWPDQTLAQCVEEQLKNAGYDEEHPVSRAARYLDDNGYFTLTRQELAEALELSQEETDKAVEGVRGLEPLGIGSFDVTQCLLAQLPQEAALARAIAEKYLPSLSAHQWEDIANSENVSVEDVKRAAKQVWACTPRPGSACGREELPFYLTPDVLIMKFRDRYEVMLCEFNVPQIHVCQEYIDMARQEKDPTLNQYIKSNLEQVKWLQQCVAARGQTLLKVTRAILGLQERFLKYGPQYLRLVTAREIADLLGMQEKTVIRVLKNKYVQCPYGVFPLTYFVLRQCDENTQSRINRKLVEGELEKILAGEREEAPYSDHKLTQILNSHGFQVSRRMVELYREELGIADDQARLNLNVQVEDECGCDDDDCGCCGHHGEPGHVCCGNHGHHHGDDLLNVDFGANTTVTGQKE